MPHSPDPRTVGRQVGGVDSGAAVVWHAPIWRAAARDRGHIAQSAHTDAAGTRTGWPAHPAHLCQYSAQSGIYPDAVGADPDQLSRLDSSLVRVTYRGGASST